VVEVNVYDFAANTCLAEWTSAAGPLPCAGESGDQRGFVQYLDAPDLEDGTTALKPGLLTLPQATADAYIRGLYPPIRVQSGEHFKATIACENGATTCLVLFRLEYQIGDQPSRAYWAYGKQYDRRPVQVDVDLGLLAGQNVRFGLAVFSLGSARDNRAIWLAPRIVYER
jgi:hypothetical protein